MLDIRARRLELRKSQGELAAELNVSQPVLSQWETGKVTPRTKDLPALAEVLGCSIDDLFREDKE